MFPEAEAMSAIWIWAVQQLVLSGRCFKLQIMHLSKHKPAKIDNVNRIRLSLLQCFKISSTDIIEFILPWLLINAHKILTLTIQILFYSLVPIPLFVFQINSCFEHFPITVFLFNKFFRLKVFIAFLHHFRFGSCDSFCN